MSNTIERFRRLMPASVKGNANVRKLPALLANVFFSASKKADRKRHASGNARLIRLNEAIVAVDSETFEAEFVTLLGELELRAHKLDGTERNAAAQLEAISKQFNYLCGSYFVSYQHLMYKLGYLFDDISVFERLCALEGVLIDKETELNSLSFRSVREWYDGKVEGISRTHFYLSNALSYIVRSSFWYNFDDITYQLLSKIREGRLDIVLSSASYSAFYVDDRSGPVGNLLDTIGSEFIELVQVEKNKFANQISPYDPRFSSVFSLLVEYMIATRAHHLSGQLTDIVEWMIGDRHEDIDSLSRIRRLRQFGLLGDLSDFSKRLTEIDTSNFQKMNSNVLKGYSVDEFNLFPGTNTNKLTLSQIGSIIDALIILGFSEKRYQYLMELSATIEKRGLSRETPTGIGTRLKIFRLREDWDMIQLSNNFYNDIAKVVGIPKSAEEIADGSSIFLFAADQCRNTPVLMSAFVPVLAGDGVSFFNLYENGFNNDIVRLWPLSPRIGATGDYLIGNELPRFERVCNWEIDLENGVLKVNGLDIFQPFYERLSRVQKRFDIDYTSPQAQTYIIPWLLIADRTVVALEKLREVAKQKNLKICFAGMQGHFVPWGIYRCFAVANPENFAFVDLNSSYENWKTNMRGQHVETIVARRRRDLVNGPSQPAFGSRENFQQWYEQEYLKRPEYFSKLRDQLIGERRTVSEAVDPINTRIGDAIRKCRSSQGAVACLLGKLPYDMGVPTMGGPAHSDMKDWLNHTIAVLKESNNLLLIKPHPHELNYKISSKSRQSFLGLIEDEISDNVILLGHHEFNLQDLNPIVDCFLLWNGSSIAELGAAGSNVIASDYWAGENYPIQLTVPSDRRDYERLLLNLRDLKMHPAFESLSSAYVCYLVEAPFAATFDLAHRSATNVNFNKSDYRPDILCQMTSTQFRERYAHIAEEFFGAWKN
ncbi:hypothetical protein [Roseibium aggregatum]|uniref:hypothetical protein n=1 Tax=Roseibium aggregatum TaxID=187304 RepID=UPI000959B347|nr:hypothetical protein [Roseibium aggregatum]UFI05712.1 hypothetical protein ST40_011435 [Roseibium aggregatum]